MPSEFDIRKSIKKLEDIQEKYIKEREEKVKISTVVLSEIDTPQNSPTFFITTVGGDEIVLPFVFKYNIDTNNHKVDVWYNGETPNGAPTVMHYTGVLVESYFIHPELKVNLLVELFKKPTNDCYVRYELMDRTCTVVTMLDELVSEHDGLKNSNLQELYNEAETALVKLYQKAAMFSLED